MKLTKKQRCALEFAYQPEGYGDDDIGTNEFDVDPKASADVIEMGLVQRVNVGTIDDVWCHLATDAGRRIIDSTTSQACRVHKDHDRCPRETTLGTKPCSCSCHGEAK